MWKIFLECDISGVSQCEFCGIMYEILTMLHYCTLDDKVMIMSFITDKTPYQLVQGCNNVTRKIITMIFLTIM